MPSRVHSAPQRRLLPICMKITESFPFDCRSGTRQHQQSIELMGSAISSHLLLECIGHLANLARLTIHALATNIMLYSIAETCTKLQALDISYSTEVTDLGLLYLCGGAGRCGVTLER